jgi:hypothetical protein
MPRNTIVGGVSVAPRCLLPPHQLRDKQHGIHEVAKPPVELLMEDFSLSYGVVIDARQIAGQMLRCD